jgi:hypothetical protein
MRFGKPWGKKSHGGVPEAPAILKKGRPVIHWSAFFMFEVMLITEADIAN